MYNFTELGWLKHVIFHPVEGYDDLRWKKKGSMKISLVIVLLFFVAMVANRQLTGFQFNGAYVKIFNIVPLFMQSVVYFFAWVVANWAICTLFNGEGSIKKICIYSAYALVPYIVSAYVAVFLSNFLVIDEAVWITAIVYIGLGWSVVLMIQAIKVAHQYTFTKTLLAMVVTIITMLIMLFLAILLISLFQQVYVFVYSVYTEITYRIRG